MTSLESKKVLITGAASGIGRATDEAAADAGARLVLTDINAELLQTVADGLGSAVLASRALDLRDGAAVQEFADEAHREHGSLDIVMNIAGISTWGRIQDLQLQHWDQLIDINLRGPVHVMRAFLPPMIDAGRGGHLVNVSSAAGLFGLPLHAAYSATKFGLRGIHEVLRFDLEPYGIRATLVCPGGVNTPLVDSVTIVGADRSDPRVQATVKRFQRHAITPEKAAAAILKGVRKNKQLVFTSPDIRAGYLAQRYFPWPYERVMRALNKQAQALVQN